MFMDMPPEIPPPAGIGDNSRHFDIARVAEEIQARIDYSNAFAAKAKSYKWKVLHAANNSELSDAAFRVLFTYLAHAKEDGTDAYPGTAKVAAVSRRNERSVGRAVKELEREGWLETERKRRDLAIRKAMIPALISKAILQHFLEATNLSDQDRPLELPNLTALKLDETNSSDEERAQDRTKSVPRSDKSVASIREPVLNQGGSSGAREASCGVLDPQPEKIEVADYEAYNKLFNSWGRKPGTNMFPVSRATTDCLLDGVFRTQPKQVLPEVTVSAIRHVTNLMLAKTALAPPGTSGPAGFPTYYQRVLEGWVRELLAMRAEAVPQTARGSPGTVPDWAVRKDKEAAKKQKLDEDLKRVAERLANEKKTT